MSFDKLGTFIIQGFSGYITLKQIYCSIVPYRNSKPPSIGIAPMYDSIKYLTFLLLETFFMIRLFKSVYFEY